VSTAKAKLEEVSIQESCKRLHLPTIASQCVRLAEQAVKEKQSNPTRPRLWIDISCLALQSKSADSQVPVVLAVR